MTEAKGEFTVLKLTMDVAKDRKSGKWWVLKRIYGGPDQAHFEEIPKYRMAWGPFLTEAVAAAVSEAVSPSEVAAWGDYLTEQCGSDNHIHVGEYDGAADQAAVALDIDAAKTRLAGGKVEEVV